jgi:preprotein translocase subunit YajC
MDLMTLNAMLAAGQSPQAGQQPAWAGIVPILILVVAFYFALIRPQQKKQKEHANMLKTLRPGDKVVTSGGIVATVVTVKEKTVTVRSADSKFEVTKSAVSDITERSGEPSES